MEEGYLVIYDHAAIAGDLDAGKIDLPLVHYERPAGEEQTASEAVSLIQIRNCEILGNVNFDSLHFKKCLDMCGCVFFQEARFKGAAFSAGAKFEDCLRASIAILPLLSRFSAGCCGPYSWSAWAGP